MHTDTVVFRQTKKLVCTQIQLCLDKQKAALHTGKVVFRL